MTEAIATPSKPPVRVLYIVGSGRSGSTVVDTLLGNHPRVESVGELANLARAHQANEFCACGQRCQGCAFWGDVWQRWWREGGISPERYRQLQARFERPRFAPRLLAEKKLGGVSFRSYQLWTRRCFEAVAEVSGKSVIVDSSKNPGRALALSQVEGLDLWLLHLVRDPRGVAYSCTKVFARDETKGLEQEIHPISPRRTATSWLIANLAASGVKRALPQERRLLLRYEELLSQPRAALAPLAKATGLDISPLARDIEEGRELVVGHTVSGNRVRMQGRLRLKSDLEWVSQLPAVEERRVRRLCGFLMRRYGYPV